MESILFWITHFIKPIIKTHPVIKRKINAIFSPLFEECIPNNQKILTIILIILFIIAWIVIGIKSILWIISESNPSVSIWR